MSEMTLRDARLLAAAGAAITTIRIALWIMPFRIIRAAVTRLVTPLRRRAGERPPLERIIWSIHVAARFIPHATCLTQSLAAQVLLMRHGYPAELRLGVTRDAGEFQAHAWVESNGRIVIGNADVWRYTPIIAD